MVSQLLILLLVTWGCLASPEALETTTSTCGPTVLTTGVVVTYESLITVPLSCYSYTATTPQYSGCPTYSCPAHPDCVLLATTTTYVPPKDGCCPTTSTTTVQGPCSTCQTGCKTEYITSTITTTTAGGAIPSTTATSGTILAPIIPSPPRMVKKEPQSIGFGDGTPCTTTIFKGDDWNIGPTRTLYAWTTTATAYADCGGCEFIVERSLQGIGPAVVFSVTYNNPEPTTTTNYLCATLW